MEKILTIDEKYTTEYKSICIKDKYSYATCWSKEYHFQVLKQYPRRKDIAIALIAQKFLT